MFNSMQKNIVLINNHKETLINMWLDYPVVQSRLIDHGIGVSFFQEKFAPKVFDHIISVIKKENNLGDCPVMGVMLMLFKRKNIPLTDVFMICTHFKNALLHFAQDNSLLDSRMLSEISLLMDYNFEGVIKEYVSLFYSNPIEANPVNEMSHSTNQEQDKDNLVLNTSTQISTSQNITSAEMYLQDIDLDMEMVDELDELEKDTLDAIDSEDTLDKNSITEAAHLFEQYSKVLSTMYEFEELATTLTSLKDLLYAVEFEALEEDTRYMLKIYFKAIITDLKSWRISIFIKMEAEDIHYLDKTLLSSIAQIQMTLTVNNGPSEEEDEIEFF